MPEATDPQRPIGEPQTSTAVSPAPSPTGTPLFAFLGNPRVVHAAAGVGLICATLIALPADQVALLHLPPVVFTVAKFVLGLLAILGLYSQGARVKGLVLLVALGAALAAPGAFAQALTVGPSLPAVAVTPGATHPVALSPGAGISVGLGLFPSTLAGKPVHILGFGLDAFGVVVPSDGVVAGALSVALQASVFDLLSVGVGMKLASTDGFGAFTGKLDHRSFFVLIGVADLLLRLMNVGHEAPPAPAPDVPRDGDHPDGVGAG